MEQSAISALLLHLSASSVSFANPSSVHSPGRAAKRILDEARDSLASALGVTDSDSLLFTGSATESINTALKGHFAFFQGQGRKVRFITSAVEHEATLETCRYLENQGAGLDVLPVNREGELELALLESALKQARGEAVLVSLMAANNETGVIFPWEQAYELSQAHNAAFHLDGVQALGKIPGFSLGNRNLLASFSAHKIGGPKGVGVLVAGKGNKLVSLLHGGAQERKRRAGTVNVAGVAAFAAAARALSSRDLAGMDRLRTQLETQVRERIPGTKVQGSGASRLPNTSNFLFEGVRGEGLVMGLDLEGFAVSSGSACNSGSILPSHVLLAMGFDRLAAQSAVRVSLGPETRAEELASFVTALEKVVGRIRALAAARGQA